MNDNDRIVKCKVCGELEYYGQMHWSSGVTMCRKCIYKEWEAVSGWKPSEEDKVYPNKI